MPLDLLALPKLIIQFERSLPPTLRHQYFRREAPMFNQPEQGFDAANAAWMADAALLAYFNEEKAREIVTKAGMSYHRFVQAPHSTQAHIFGKGGQVVIAFRGTQVIRPALSFGEFVRLFVTGFDQAANITADWFSNLDCPLLTWDGGGRVHKGFLKALDGALPMVESTLAEVKARNGGNNLRVWFTGHSLGGALATLAAARHEAPETVFTFGAPRVGDASFCAAYRQRVPQTWRMVHNRDLVARVPLHEPLPGVGAFQHVEDAIFIEKGGTVRKPVSPAEVSGQPLGAPAGALVEFLRQQLLAAGSKETLGGLIEHGPIFYAEKLWAWAEGYRP